MFCSCNSHLIIMSVTFAAHFQTMILFNCITFILLSILVCHMTGAQYVWKSYCLVLPIVKNSKFYLICVLVKHAAARIQKNLLLKKAVNVNLCSHYRKLSDIKQGLKCWCAWLMTSADLCIKHTVDDSWRQIVNWPSPFSVIFLVQ